MEDKEKILNLLKSTDPTNQQIGLMFSESLNVDLDEEFWNPLNEIYYLSYRHTHHHQQKNNC